MPICVLPLHYVTVEFRLPPETGGSRVAETSGTHRFLYGVESWIDGVDQQLDNLKVGDILEILLESEAAAAAASRLLGQDQRPGFENRLKLEIKILEVVKAEPREVVRSLADTVKCCDHCGDH
ncbi:MAG: hypothetical protein JSU72_00350 [Deltaproteobacteria bacterium]|nr:MAG: hypothetical protein JSU72_00350 [Deltaproteobacteria bacterium]